MQRHRPQINRMSSTLRIKTMARFRGWVHAACTSDEVMNDMTRPWAVPPAVHGWIVPSPVANRGVDARAVVRPPDDGGSCP